MAIISNPDGLGHLNDVGRIFVVERIEIALLEVVLVGQVHIHVTTSVPRSKGKRVQVVRIQEVCVRID